MFGWENAKLSTTLAGTETETWASLPVYMDILISRNNKMARKDICN